MRAEAPSTRSSLRSSKDKQKIRAPKLPHLVAERLRAQIANGELQPGDRLPPEAELLKEFGVSRPTLREALRVLESETLIQLGRGARSGAIILAPSIEMAAQYGSLYLATHDTTLGQIHQVRMLLEPPLAALHARRPRKDFLRALRHCVQGQRDALEIRDYAAAALAVNEFHDELVRFTDNTALRLLAGMLHEISTRVYPQLSRAGRAGDQKTIWRRSEKSAEAHAELVELIAIGKASQAEAFWREYMQNTAAFLRRTKLDKLQVQVPPRSV